MSSMNPVLFTSLALLGTLAAACAAPLPPTQSSLGPKLADPGPTKRYHVTFPDEGRGVARYVRLTLGEDLAKGCGLVQAHFELDSAEPLPQDQIVIKALAACLGGPEYGSRQLWLVGRADRRGAADYNEGLALRRAERVKQLLVDAGMAADRISTVSRGDRDAVGDDTQYSYGYDRRVDAVVDLGHAPR
jgi:outer membrane protein OmpA-like peptidoglycan-associated protein